MPLAALTLLLALQTTPAKPAQTATTPAPKVKITELAPGKGAEAVRVGDYIEVNYIGKLTTGKEFDRNGDVPFKTLIGVGMVIPGWDQGMLGMKPGGKRRLEIPSVLAYGERGAGADIPANADLDFEVELVKIHRAKMQTTKPGNGAPLTPADVPTFHYNLTLADGKKVASSRDNNVPARAPIQQLIPGFVQGLLGMKPGEIRKVTLTPELAYGSRELPEQDVTDAEGKVVQKKGSLIPANSTLIFEIELISAAKAQS